MALLKSVISMLAPSDALQGEMDSTEPLITSMWNWYGSFQLLSVAVELARGTNVD